MVAMTEQILRRIDKQRPDPPADLRTRAAVTLAMALGIPAFRAQISRSIGTDILSPERDQRVSLAMLDIQSHPAISPDAARTLRRITDLPPLRHLRLAAAHGEPDRPEKLCRRAGRALWESGVTGINA
jgi:hypothetical protein